MKKVRLIQGKGDWTSSPPTGASDADLYQLSNDFIVQGGVLDLDGGDALVTELDTPEYKVQIAKGTIYVLNSAWTQNSHEPKFYQVVSDAVEELDITTNSSGSTRVDLVALKIDKVTTPNDDGDNVVPFVVIEGTPGAGAPALPDDHELLATLTLPDGYAAVTNSMIADGRKQIYLETRDINNGFLDLVDGSTITIDLSQKKRKFRVTLAGNRTFAVTNPKLGDTFYLRLTNDSTARTPNWFSNITWIGVEDDPDMANYVSANKVGGWLFICTDEDTPSFDGYFLGAEE